MFALTVRDFAVAMTVAIEKLLTYALGRTVQDYDMPAKRVRRIES